MGKEKKSGFRLGGSGMKGVAPPPPFNSSHFRKDSPLNIFMRLLEGDTLETIVKTTDDYEPEWHEEHLVITDDVIDVEADAFQEQFNNAKAENPSCVLTKGGNGRIEYVEMNGYTVNDMGHAEFPRKTIEAFADDILTEANLLERAGLFKTDDDLGVMEAEAIPKTALGIILDAKKNEKDEKWVSQRVRKMKDLFQNLNDTEAKLLLGDTLFNRIIKNKWD